MYNVLQFTDCECHFDSINNYIFLFYKFKIYFIY